MAIAYINYLEVISLKPLQPGGSFRCELSFIRLPGEDNDLACAKNIISNLYVSSMWFAYFLVFDFIEDMTAI